MLIWNVVKVSKGNSAVTWNSRLFKMSGVI